jgi:hypothetical protein
MVLLRDHGYHKLFNVAFPMFKKRFKDKTGMEWDQRLDKLPPVEGKYIYNPPAGGKPVGEVPKGWNPPPDSEPENKVGSAVGIMELQNGEALVMADPDLRDDTDSEVDDDGIGPTILRKRPQDPNPEQESCGNHETGEVRNGEDYPEDSPGSKDVRDNTTEFIMEPTKKGKPEHDQ